MAAAVTAARSKGWMPRNPQRRFACVGARDLRAALELGVRIGLDDIRGDEFHALVVLAEEQEKLERERLNGSHT